MGTVGIILVMLKNRAIRCRDWHLVSAKGSKSCSKLDQPSRDLPQSLANVSAIASRLSFMFSPISRSDHEVLQPRVPKRAIPSVMW